MGRLEKRPAYGAHLRQNGFGPGGYPSGMPPTRILLPAVLFVITVITTVVAGSLYEGADIFSNPAELVRGIPFSASLLLILGTHEFGHYIASRRHGVFTTLPMFIPGPPLPFPMIGTFGAVIRIKSPITTRSALVDIGAAGPLSGFVVALFVAAIGLSQSSILPVAPSGATIGLGDSIIFKLLSMAILGPLPEGHDIILHPVAFAGWIGFFVTAMNLLPVGQLDGGHIIYSIIGEAHRVFSRMIIILLLALGLFTWPGWFIWGILISVLGLWHPPVQDQMVPMDARRRATSAAALIVFILTFIPTPIYIV